MSTIDFTPPLATLLQENLHEAHEAVAKSPEVDDLLGGRWHRDEYIKYLMMLWHIYGAMENALDSHATHPIIEPTYNPTLLARSSAISADISFLLDVPEELWQEHPSHASLLQSPPPVLTSYVDRIRQLDRSGDTARLLAHAYVRYLGDLSGGQTVRRTVTKAYGLDEKGVSFYAFKELRSPKKANQGEMKRIKEWYKAGLNKVGDISVDVKDAALDEAKKAFEFNAALFGVIESKGQHPDRTTTQGSQERAYNISQILPVIAAICIAHFILATGGFTAESGYQKLLTMGRWHLPFTGSAALPE